MRSKKSRFDDVVPWYQGIFIRDFMAAHGAEFTGFDQPKKQREGFFYQIIRKKKKEKHGNETIVTF